MFEEIEARIEKAKEALGEIGSVTEDISPREFHDYMTGEIFSEDTTTLEDILGNEFIMMHEVAEISELKRMGRTIDKRVIVDSPKTVVYEAHLTAMELELDYGMLRKDYYWVKMRLRRHRESVLENDPSLPETLRPRAEAIYSRFKNQLGTGL